MAGKSKKAESEQEQEAADQTLTVQEDVVGEAAPEGLSVATNPNYNTGTYSSPATTNEAMQEAQDEAEA